MVALVPGHELRGDQTIRHDSPVAPQVVMYMLFSDVVQEGWPVSFFDVQDAFLVGRKNERYLYQAARRRESRSTPGSLLRFKEQLDFPKHHAFGGWNVVKFLLEQASRRLNDIQLPSTFTARRASIEAKWSVMLMTVCRPDQEKISKQRSKKLEINNTSSTKSQESSQYLEGW